MDKTIGKKTEERPLHSSPFLPSQLHCSLHPSWRSGPRTWSSEPNISWTSPRWLVTQSNVTNLEMSHVKTRQTHSMEAANYDCSLVLMFLRRGKIVLGYTEAELRVRGSGYQFIHAADMLYCAENHVRSTFFQHHLTEATWVIFNLNVFLHWIHHRFAWKMGIFLLHNSDRPRCYFRFSPVKKVEVVRCNLVREFRQLLWIILLDYRADWGKLPQKRIGPTNPLHDLHADCSKPSDMIHTAAAPHKHIMYYKAGQGNESTLLRTVYFIDVIHFI